jgi:hypothetical protein
VYITSLVVIKCMQSGGSAAGGDINALLLENVMAS